MVDWEEVRASVRWASVVAAMVVSSWVVNSVVALSMGHVRTGGMLSCRAVVKWVIASALHLGVRVVCLMNEVGGGVGL